MRMPLSDPKRTMIWRIEAGRTGAQSRILLNDQVFYARSATLHVAANELTRLELEVWPQGIDVVEVADGLVVDLIVGPRRFRVQELLSDREVGL